MYIYVCIYINIYIGAYIIIFSSFTDHNSFPNSMCETYPLNCQHNSKCKIQCHFTCINNYLIIIVN